LYLPARLWKSGENRLLLKLQRAEGELGKPVFLKSTGLELRFGAPPEIDFQHGPSVIEAPQRGMPVVITTKP
jgi:hypothetical protein